MATTKHPTAKREIEEFAEDDRVATELANNRGRPFSQGAPVAAIIAAVAVFMLLYVFAALTLPDDQNAFWPVMSLTAIIAGATYIIVQQQEKRWRANYHEALRNIRAERMRDT